MPYPIDIAQEPRLFPRLRGHRSRFSLRHLALWTTAALSFATHASAALSFQPDSLQGPTGQIVLQGTLAGSPATAQVVLSQDGRALDTLTLTTGSGGQLSATLPFLQGVRKPSTSDTLWLKTPGRTTDVVVARLLDGTFQDSLRLTRPELSISLAQKSVKDTLIVTMQGTNPASNGLRTLKFQVDNEAPILRTASGSTYRSTISSLLTPTSGGLRNEVIIRVTFVDPLYGDTAIAALTQPITSRRISFLPLSTDSADTLLGPRGTFIAKVIDAWEPGDSTLVQLAYIDSLGSRAQRSIWLKRTGGSTFTDTLHITQASAATGDTLVLGRPWPAGSVHTITATLPPRSVLPKVETQGWIVRPKLVLSLGHLLDTNEVQIALQGGFADESGQARIRLECPSLLPPGPRTQSLTRRDTLFWLETVSFKGQIDEWKDSVPLVGQFIDPLYRDTILDTLKLFAPWYPGRLDIDIRKLDPRARQQANITLYEHDPDSTRIDTLYVSMPDADSIALIETGEHTGIFWKRVDATVFDRTWPHRLPRLTWTVPVHYQDPRHFADSSSVLVDLRFDVPFFEMGLRHPIVERARGGSTTNPGLTFGLEPVKQQDTVFSRDTDPGQGVWARIWDRTLVTMRLYDNLGVLVNQWSGELEPTDGDNGSLFLLRWDGRGANGRPAPRGVYLLRTYIRRDDGRRAIQEIYRIGLN